MISDNYWNESWTHSSYPTSGEKWVYLIAGIRNVRSVQVHGGLWANVGQTTKSVEERLCGLDYARKAAGGEWVILNKWRVPAWISDKDIHEEIKKNKKILWKNSVNSEEFLFYNDSGNGNAASLIVAEAIVKIMNTESEKIFRKIEIDRSMLKEKLQRLSDKRERIVAESGFIEPKSGWKDFAKEETIWRKSIREEVSSIERLDWKKEILSSFLFSYVIGCISIVAYLIFEPSTLTFLLVFLPASSIMSSIIGFLKMKAGLKEKLRGLKEKI
jgi:hypothetical protein